MRATRAQGGFSSEDNADTMPRSQHWSTALSLHVTASHKVPGVLKVILVGEVRPPEKSTHYSINQAVSPGSKPGSMFGNIDP